MTAYSFHIFGDDRSVNPTEIETSDHPTKGAAKVKARRLATKHRAPVDLSLAGYGPDSAGWGDAYIGTATPWPSDIGGARFERLT